MSHIYSRLNDVCSKCRILSPLKVTRWFLTSTAAQPEFLKGLPHRKHPGATHLKTVRLPERLQQGALCLIHRSEVKNMSERVGKLTNILWSRKCAVEPYQLRQRATALEKKLMENEKDLQSDTDKNSFEAQIREKVLTELRKTIHHWKPLRYDAELGVVYMAGRLAGGYAAVLRALNEIKKRDPSFTPCSLLDFGSGVGTVLWASHTLWGDSLKEYVCVDASGAMNILAEQLLTGGGEESEPLIKHAYFRQFLPVSPKVQTDLVTAAFSLSELASQHDRQETVLTLWRKTSSYLVLVENGTKEGHQILMEARDTLLKSEEKVTYDPRRAVTFAPCTHDLSCPKLLNQTVVPCNVLQSYFPLPVAGSPERRQEKFSYLIMSRERRGEAGPVAWARLTGPVLRRPRHVQCQICCSSGEIKQLAVTARHHGRHMYRCARSSDWGDLLPIVQPEEDDTRSP